MKVLAAKSQEGSEKPDTAGEATETRPKDFCQHAGTCQTTHSARRGIEKPRGSQSLHGHQERDATTSRATVAVSHSCLAGNAGVLSKPVGPGGIVTELVYYTSA